MSISDATIYWLTTVAYTAIACISTVATQGGTRGTGQLGTASATGVPGNTSTTGAVSTGHFTSAGTGQGDNLLDIRDISEDGSKSISVR